MKRLMACGQRTEAEILEELYREQSDDETLKVEVITFSVLDYHTKKFIGSKEFIEQEYRNWIATRPPKKRKKAKSC